MFVREPRRDTQVAAEHEVVVLGGGARRHRGGQSAARVSGACFAMGQAAGSAAHLALKLGVALPDLDTGELQTHLLQNGAWLG